MEKEEARSQKQDARREDGRESSSVPGLQRRKMLGWMGVGIIGAFALNVLPFKIFPKRIFRRNKVKSPGTIVAINDLAVKRSRKASRNG